MSTKWLYSAGLIIAVFFAFYLYQKFRLAPQIDVNTLELSDLDGNSFQISQFKGKKVILCFGASWCGNCHEELETLSKIKGSKLETIEVLVISDESNEKIERFKNRGNYPFTFLRLRTPFDKIGIHSLPTTYLLNANMKVVKEEVGYMNWEDPSTLEHYKKLMD